MGILEDINSGKFNLIIYVIIFGLFFHQYWGKQLEPMAELDISPQIKEAVKQQYVADVEAIRNLSEIATKLQKEGLTIPGNLTVAGQIKSQSLDSLNSKIDSVNSSLTNNFNTNNTNLTNNVNLLQGQINNINSNLNNYVRYSDNIRITNRGTGQEEHGEPFVGVCGYGPPSQCSSKINVTMVAHPAVSTFKIVKP